MAVFSGNGSNTAPSFTFSSDTNTGIYRVDADKIAITTAGVAGLTVGPTQKVGIGTTDPDTDLHLQGNSTGIKFDGTLGTGNVHNISLSGANDQDFQITAADDFYVNANEFRFRSQDQSTQFFAVSGNTGYFTVAPSAGGHAIFNDNSADADFRVESDTNSDAFFVDGAGGGVGIDTIARSLSKLSLLTENTETKAAIGIVCNQPGTDGVYRPSWASGMVYVPPNSSNNQLTIPTLATSFNRTCMVRMMIIPMIYNSSNKSLCAEAIVAVDMIFPSTIATTTLQSSGNISSISGNASGEILVNFTSNYSGTLGGLSVYLEYLGQLEHRGGIDWDGLSLN